MRRCAAWVTEWSGKIRRNLPVKIFCFTCLLLLAVCIVTYGLIAWMMPVTYQADRNRVLSEQAESLIQELSKTTLSACGPLLEKFASDYDAQVSILDETGQPVAGTKDLAQTEEEEGRVTFSQIQTEEGMTLQTNESIHITQTVATPFSFGCWPRWCRCLFWGPFSTPAMLPGYPAPWGSCRGRMRRCGETWNESGKWSGSGWNSLPQLPMN